MFPATIQPATCINRFWLKDVSYHHFWQCPYELQRFSYISHVQRLVQQAISVRIPNSKFPLEIHQFMNETLIRSLLRIHPSNSTKVTICPSEGTKLCTPLSHYPFTGPCFAETWWEEVFAPQVWPYLCCRTVTLFDRSLPGDTPQLSWCRTHSDYLHFL